MSNSFEDNLNNLENIVESLENGTSTLDEAIKAFEKGMKLSALCHKKLDNVEQKIEVLIKDRDGKTNTEPFQKESE